MAFLAVVVGDKFSISAEWPVVLLG